MNYSFIEDGDFFLSWSCLLMCPYLHALEVLRYVSYLIEPE